MQPKSSLFILEKREVSLLTLVSGVAFLFSFTLGVHYGKKVGDTGGSHGDHAGGGHSESNGESIQHSAVVADKIPSKIEFSEQARGVKEAGDLSLAEALESEVARTGIKLDSPRQVELPEHTKSRNGGATTPHERLVKETVLAPKRKNMPSDEPQHSKSQDVGHSSAPGEVEGGKYILQIGSYPVMKEARERIALLRAEGLNASMKSVELGERGTWYRVFVGDYKSKSAADSEGKRLKDKHLIENYVVSSVGTGVH